jgi:hypothetical protein
MTDCDFADNCKNKEGWLVVGNGELVCLDRNEYCTKCKADDGEDYTFTIV